MERTAKRHTKRRRVQAALTAMIVLVEGSLLLAVVSVMLGGSDQVVFIKVEVESVGCGLVELISQVESLL